MFNGRVNKVWLGFLVVFVLIFVLYYFPLPYYISAPGDAIELQPIIEVEEGYEEQGSFMLTTVKMGGANFISYARAHLDNYMELIDKETILAHYDDEEDYTEYQLQVMETSQDAAIMVAYKLADKPVEVVNEGVFVTQTIDGMPASEYLQIGDQIMQVDDLVVEESEQLIEYIGNKGVGDEVTIHYIREDEVHQATVELMEFPQPEDHLEEEGMEQGPRAGIGIGTLTHLSVEVEPPINIKTDRIGGPSAGLMFTLEIYNQLTEEDITKGYRVAGTGTIDSEGNVGRIGGVHQKVAAADKANAEIFFAPYEGGADQSNYVRAKEAAEDIGAELDVVPVDTVQDALDYMDSLPDKS